MKRAQLNKKRWTAPELFIIACAVNDKSIPNVHEASYHPIGGGLSSNPGLGGHVTPATVVAQYES